MVCAKILECASQPDYTFHTCLDLGGSTAVPDTVCANLHEGDLVAYNTKTDAICTLDDLHAEQKEFPHCIPDGIFVLHEKGVLQNGDDIKLIGDDHVVEFEITPNRPDCLSVIGLAREAAATYEQPLTLHEPEVQGGADGVLTDLLDIETPAADLCAPVHRPDGPEREDRPLLPSGCGSGCAPWACVPSTTSWISPTM